jgi:TPR repeat protein
MISKNPWLALLGVALSSLIATWLWMGLMHLSGPQARAPKSLSGMSTTMPPHADQSNPVPQGTGVTYVELSQGAADGDAAAQYAMTQFITDPVEGEKMLRRSAMAGYATAVITLASSLMNHADGGLENGLEARSLLESASRSGSYRAMRALENCLERGRCGPEDRQAALSWSIPSRLLFEKKAVKTNELPAEESQLIKEMTSQQLAEAQATAQAWVQSMKVVDPFAF